MDESDGFLPLLWINIQCFFCTMSNMINVRIIVWIPTIEVAVILTIVFPKNIFAKTFRTTISLIVLTLLCSQFSIGKPVIFVHGGPGGGTDPYMARYFDPQAYRIILVDQRGCGDSVPFADLRDNTTYGRLLWTTKTVFNFFLILFYSYYHSYDYYQCYHHIPSFFFIWWVLFPKYYTI